VRDDFANRAPAFAAIKLAAMMGLHSLRAACAGFNSFAHSLVINSAADANDHANDLQQVRMIVKNDSQVGIFRCPQETGGMSAVRLAM
jgi:hypothetical protein